MSLMNIILICIITCNDTIEIPEIDLPPVQQTGTASWYGDGSGDNGMHGRLTATEEIFRPELNTCASRTIPLNQIIIVEDVDTGNSTYCRVNDRGPYGVVLDSGEWVAVVNTGGRYKVMRREGDSWGETEYHDSNPGEYRRVIDLSRGTFQSLGLDLDQGLTEVKIRYHQ